jgi:hypothetical protein
MAAKKRKYAGKQGQKRKKKPIRSLSAAIALWIR